MCWRCGARATAQDKRIDGERTVLQLPNERNGLLFVFRVFERTSYALILSVNVPVFPGDASPSPDDRAGVLDADEFDAWFRLLETPGLGREGARRLLAGFGSADAVLQASKAAPGSRWSAPQLAQRPGQRARGLPARLARSAARGWPAANTRQVLSIGDARLPAAAAADAPTRRCCCTCRARSRC